MEFIENFEKQLEEIEILKSIYSNPNEFLIEDEYALFEMNEFLCDKDVNKIPQHRIGFIIKFNANYCDETTSSSDNDINILSSQIPVEINCRLPRDYPLMSQPEILVRCSKESINKKFSEDLNNHIQEIQNSECSVLSIIDWIKDNLFKYLTSNKKQCGNIEKDKNTVEFFTRAWIYFHHIYSTEKRQSLVKWAKEFELTGFVLPGKPGVMCIEGNDVNIQDFMTRVRKLPWQKVQNKDLQSFKVNSVDELNQQRKFNSFEEKTFTNESSHSHDLGLLFNFLKEKSLSNVFSLFFGVDGKTSVSNNKSE